MDYIERCRIDRNNYIHQRILTSETGYYHRKLAQLWEEEFIRNNTEIKPKK